MTKKLRYSHKTELRLGLSRGDYARIKAFALEEGVSANRLINDWILKEIEEDKNRLDFDDLL